MNILSADTSTQAMSLCLMADGGFEEKFIFGGVQHSEDLLTEIDALLKRRSMTIKDVDLLCCMQGPGSFTSLRIAFASMKGISLATGKPLVSVPTLDVLERVSGPCRGIKAVVMDARKKRYYIGLYKDGKEIMKPLDGNAEDIAKDLEGENGIMVTGPDASAFAEKLKPLIPNVEILVDDVKRSTGLMLCILGKERFLKVGKDDIGMGPMYIRRSDAEEMLMEKMGNADGKV